jgi:Ca2+-binding EF-hand superfamily protein
MAEYVRDLVRKFDRNSDGLLSIQELTDGLRKIGISLTNKEIQALMTKLDLNRDGEVSAEEILKTLSSIGTGFAVSPSSNSTLDNVISKMVQSGKSFPSLKDYAKHLIRKWDKDSDGIITFSELCDGIYKLNIMISQPDKRALMELLDIDRDGKITETELFRVLSGGASPEIIDQTLRKIAGGAQGYSNLAEYSRDLVRKFDTNGDGLISIYELADGLAKLGIFLT